MVSSLFLLCMNKTIGRWLYRDMLKSPVFGRINLSKTGDFLLYAKICAECSFDIRHKVKTNLLDSRMNALYTYCNYAFGNSAEEVAAMYQYFFDSPVGRLRLVESHGFIKEISKWDVPDARLNSEGKIIKNSETYTEAVTEKTPVLAEAEQQLKEYFAGVRQRFELPLKPEGTAFFQSVWKELQEIPYGETRTYGEIAKGIGKPAAARAVGMANHHNPIMIVIPCHRVIGANGDLVGYAGGLDIKKRLLNLEKSHES